MSFYTSYTGTTLGEVLPEVLSDIFHNRMFHKEAVDSALLFEADADADADAHIIVSILGPMGPETSSKRAADQAGLRNIDLETMEKFIVSQEQPHGAIAIIGFAGEIPGCEDMQQFWDILAEGRDLHKKVAHLLLLLYPRIIVSNYRYKPSDLY